MFNEANLFILFLIFALLVVGISWMFFGDVPLFKKRYFPILVLALLLFAIGGTIILKPIVDIKNQEPELIEACRNDLASAGYTTSDGHSVNGCGGKTFYTSLKYESTDIFTPTRLRVKFNDGVNILMCDMEWSGSGWVVTSRGSTMASMCPN